MLNVFRKVKEEEMLYIQLSDGRVMFLEDLVKDYERLLKEESSNKAITSGQKDNKAITSGQKDNKAITSGQKDNKTIKQELKVGEWFLIDRGVIAKNREKIRRVCNEAGNVGKAYLKRFEKSNKIADKNPYQYPYIIKTYIFKYCWDYLTEREMRDMCEEIGDGECDEVICDLELQMRICNGESAHALFEEADKLPRVRVIQLRNGGTGYFGGGTDDNFNNPPAKLFCYSFIPTNEYYKCTPYAFRRLRTKK